jgi:tetratricopeptide (TPR) repeat protein
MARAVPPRAWEQSVELKPGANSVTLDSRNMASLDTILSGGRSQSDVAAKPPSTDKPLSTPPSNPTGGSADAYIAQGNKYLNAKQYAKAVEAYKKAIALQPSAGAYNGLGLAYDGLEQYPNEVAALQQAVRLKSDDALLRFNLASAYVSTEQFEEAIGALRESLRLKPNDADATYLLGIAYVEMGRKEEALQVLKTVQRLAPAMAKNLAEEIDLIEGNDPNALLDLGLSIRLKPQNHKLALRLFRRVIVMKKDPETVAEAYWWMGDLYSQKDQGAKATAAYQQAAVLYQQALRAKPNDAVLLSKLCYNYIVLGRKQEAQQIYGRLQSVDREKAQKLSESINKMK